MKKEIRIKQLSAAINHMIKGNKALAEVAFKNVAKAAAARIALGETAEELLGDVEDDTEIRRIVQRELEDDLSAAERGELEGEFDDEELSGDVDDGELIAAIIEKLQSGDVTDETMAEILGIIVGDEGELEVGPEIDGEEGEGLDSDLELDGLDLSDDDFDGLGDETIRESQDHKSLIDKLKFALYYEYDQYLDAGGDPQAWPEFALQDVGPELQSLLDQIPEDRKWQYDAALEKFIQRQVE